MAGSPFPSGEASMASKAARKSTPKSAPPRKPRAQLRFKRADLVRAIRSAKDAGLPIDRVEVDPNSGKISVLVSQPGDAAGERNEWDEP